MWDCQVCCWIARDVTSELSPDSMMDISYGRNTSILKRDPPQGRRKLCQQNQAAFPNSSLTDNYCRCLSVWWILVPLRLHSVVENWIPFRMEQHSRYNQLESPSDWLNFGPGAVAIGFFLHSPQILLSPCCYRGRNPYNYGASDDTKAANVWTQRVCWHQPDVSENSGHFLSFA